MKLLLRKFIKRFTIELINDSLHWNDEVPITQWIIYLHLKLIEIFSFCPKTNTELPKIKLENYLLIYLTFVAGNALVRQNLLHQWMRFDESNQKKIHIGRKGQIENCSMVIQEGVRLFVSFAGSMETHQISMRISPQLSSCWKSLSQLKFA